jgi:dTDP-4-dehydrorhamnose reductase
MRLLVTGGSGQLGQAISRLGMSQHQVSAPDSVELDVTDLTTVRAVVAEYSPDVIVHSGAMTDVDGCERSPREAFRVNGLGTQNVAAVTAARGIPLVYISTNFVFDGELDRPYTEFDQPNPISEYGASKLAGERAVSSLNPDHMIVRTGMVFDESGRNFVSSMLRLASEHPRLTVVDDQFGNPTYAADLAVGVLQLIEQSARGTFHLTNNGTVSWFTWATKIFEITGIDIPVEPIPASEFKRDATPPSNGALDNLAAAALGIDLPNWLDALERCLQRRSELNQ